jgi:hypothetical protein
MREFYENSNILMGQSLQRQDEESGAEMSFKNVLLPCFGTRGGCSDFQS